MSIKDRFKMIMDREKLTAGAFAESIGVAQATISHILGSRNKYPSTEVILKLHQCYKDINLEWLLTGKGNMSNDSSSTESGGFDYPLFADNPENPSYEPNVSENRKEIALETAQKPTKEIVKQEIIYKEFSLMIILMKHSNRKIRRQLRLFAQIPVSLQPKDNSSL